MARFASRSYSVQRFVNIALLVLAASLATTCIRPLLSTNSVWTPFPRGKQHNVSIEINSTSGSPTSLTCPDAVPTVDEAVQATDIVRDCLDPDFAPWESKKYTMADLKATHGKLHAERPDVVALIQIKDDVLTFLDRTDDCNGVCNHIARVIRDKLRHGLRTGRLNLPDCTFILNVYDHPMCPNAPGLPSERRCSAPVFSHLRRKNLFNDILVPSFHRPFQVCNVPWEQKQSMAFFRGTPFCSGAPHYINPGGASERVVNCSRLILTDMSLKYPDLLNVSLTQGFTSLGREWKSQNPGRTVPMCDVAKYQMALNLDGMSASNRFGELLPMNSVVLKQESPYEEYFYRSVRPCVHYLPFWNRTEEDVLDVISDVRQNPKMAMEISANAQAFALAHLTADAKWRYWELTLRRYARLLADDAIPK